MFEQFKDVDIKTMTLQDLITGLFEKRNFSEAGIDTMIKASPAKLTGAGKARARVLLHPPHKDFVKDVEPLFDSEAKHTNETCKPTIGEIIEVLSAIDDNLIEDDFLELPCEVLIEFDEENDQFEELKTPPTPSSSNSNRVEDTDTLERFDNYFALDFDASATNVSRGRVPTIVKKKHESGSPPAINRKRRHVHTREAV